MPADIDAQFSSLLAEFLSHSDQISLFLLVILILLVGAWLTSIISGSNINRENARFVSLKQSTLPNKSIRRKLVMLSFQGDNYGVLAETILKCLRFEYAPTIWAKYFGSNILGPFSVITGITRAKSKCQALNQKKQYNLQTVEITLNGELQDEKLDLKFFPQGPIHLVNYQQQMQSEAILPSAKNKNDTSLSHSELSSERADFVFECSDFPLSELKGIELRNSNQQLSKTQATLFHATVAGIMSRGCGIRNQITSVKKIEKWAVQLDKSISPSKEKTSDFQTEIIVVAAWCYLISGVRNRDENQLKRALSLYQLLGEDQWQNREKAEWAGIKSNEAYAAFMLMQIYPKNSYYPEQIKKAALEGMRNFRRDNFPHSWGKLMCKLALAYGGACEGAFDQKDSLQINQSVENDQELPHTHQSIEIALDEAIELWKKNHQQDAMCEAYFAKGRLALSSAKRNMGVQGLERAENGFLAALSLSEPEGSLNKNKTPSFSQSDIRFELGQLYSGWGTRFGDASLIEKAIHQFEALLELKYLLKSSKVKEVNLALAECYLNYGGVTNKASDHKEAVFRFNELLDKSLSLKTQERVERCAAVARARLALLARKKEPVIIAISSICAVIGQKEKQWPSQDVLLRLRARLRELLFSLEGDDIALDRAIRDRRELVELASVGLQDLRWAVEVGGLVGLLSKRQYKNNGNMEDFNEAHYLLEKAIAITEDKSQSEEHIDGEATEKINASNTAFNIPHIKGDLYLKLAKLLASFARVHFDEQAIREAATYYKRFVDTTPRSVNPIRRAEALSEIGLIMVDLSEQYGSHDGLSQAKSCFSEAHDIYLETGLIDLSNRMRRFLENAEAACLAYQLPSDHS